MIINNYFVCKDAHHIAVLLLGVEPSGEAVDLVRSLKTVTPKPITQVAVFAELDFFLALSGEFGLQMWKALLGKTCIFIFIFI